MIIGTTSKLAAGKGEVAEILKEKGFIYTSLSDYLRNLLRSRGEEITRKKLQDLANHLRKKHGPNYIAMKVAEQFEKGRNYVVDSIRNPAEVNELRKQKDFMLVRITADDQIRFERIKARNREQDPKTFEELMATEARENKAIAHNQQLDVVFGMADVIIENNGTLEELRARVEGLLE